jgi:hypothetical protein
LHVTDGAKFEHDVSIQVEPVYSGDPELRQAGLALRANVIADISKQGSTPQSYYMSFAENDNPASGFVDSVSDPRFSTGYFQLRNRLAMLVGTHGVDPFKTWHIAALARLPDDLRRVGRPGSFDSAETVQSIGDDNTRGGQMRVCPGLHVRPPKCLHLRE